MLNRNWSSAGSLAQPRGVAPSAATRGLGRRFGNLRVRPKLIVLHNLFFLILTAAVYFTLIPALERRIAEGASIEIDYREGSARDLHLPPHVQTWLDSHPGKVWRDQSGSGQVYLKVPDTGTYRRVTLPLPASEAVLSRAKVTLFAVLGLIYILAVLLLEVVIMPRYVYIPLRLMLDADEATRRGDRDRELIDETLILSDEIGTIMRSRNETVAELRRHEDDLEQALARLEAQDRLASLGLLSASVAHEMNTPLAVLHGSTEKLLETTKDAATQERLRRMLRVTERLRNISEGLVEFARVRRESFDKVVLKTLFEEAWALVSIDDKASQVSFELHAGEELSAIGNADRLIQVFVNLFRNALLAVPSGGHIRVRTRPFERDHRPWVSVAIEDDGPGIPADVLPNIFDAFVSSRLDSKGTGLGLTVAAGIVQQHEGTIMASNCAGGGARLEVTLPAAV